MDRMENMKKAKKHEKEMKLKFKEEIEKSIEGTTIFEKVITMDLSDAPRKLYDTVITVEDARMQDIVKTYNGPDTALLNFASFTSPGGGYIRGAMAQEESLCHDSTLYQVLSNFKSIYEWNKNRIYNGLYVDSCLYSPGIVFFNYYKCNVLTIAAPNFSRFMSEMADYNIPIQDIYNKNNAALKRRIDFLLSALEYTKQKTIILGAFGCGVFHQSPVIVSTYFKELLETKYKGVFERVIFAVPNDRNRNYQSFKFIIGGK